MSIPMNPSSNFTEKPSSNAKSPPKDPFVNMWKCGDQYQFSIPKEDGSPWEAILKPLLKRDKSQCDAWKDEVENLLIFAGLFSAVVTAFLIESYKELQPDSNEAVVFLLSHIAARLDSTLSVNASSQPGFLSVPFPLQIPVTPIPPPAFRVNILWFLSLVLSLTTVLIGIVCLQWLREHLRYPNPVKPMDQLALFHMRSEGLERWYVPQIFTALPLLLQAALALFLIGLVEFLLALGKKVAIPVIVFIGIPLIFIIVTTVMPTFQAFSLSLPLETKIPSQCPYKSPQSRMFRRIVCSSDFSFRTCEVIYLYFRFLFFKLPLSILNIFRSPQSRSGGTTFLRESTRHFRRTWHSKSWFSFDEAWLGIRNRHCIKTYIQRPQQEGFPAPEHPILGPQALYDITDALRMIRKEPNLDESTQYALYYCVEDLTSIVLDNKLIRSVDDVKGIAWISRQNRFLQTLLGYDASPSDHVLAFSHLFSDPSLGTLYDENKLLFFSTHGYWWQCDTIRRHLTELYTRLLLYCYAIEPHQLDPTISGISNIDYYDIGLLAPNRKLHLFHLDPMYLDSKNNDLKVFSQQYGLILKSIFDFAAFKNLEEEKSLSETFHVHRYLQVLIPLAVDIQHGDDILQLLEHIITLLNDHLNDHQDKKSDLLFYTVSLYMHDLLNFKFLKELSRSRIRSSAQHIVQLLRRYQAEIGTGNAILEKRLNIGDFSDQRWWSFLVQFPDAPDIYRSMDEHSQDYNADELSKYSAGPYPRSQNPSQDAVDAEVFLSVRQSTANALDYASSFNEEVLNIQRMISRDDVV